MQPERTADDMHGDMQVELCPAVATSSFQFSLRALFTAPFVVALVICIAKWQFDSIAIRLLCFITVLELFLDCVSSELISHRPLRIGLRVASLVALLVLFHFIWSGYSSTPYF